MSWRQIRSSGGLNGVVKGLIEAQQRQQAESGVEDINDLEQARVDFDGIIYTDNHIATLNGTESDTDNIGYSDLEEGRLRGPKFRTCGGDGTTFTVANAPVGNKAKTSDTYIGDGGFATRSEAAIVGHCQIPGAGT